VGQLEVLGEEVDRVGETGGVDSLEDSEELEVLADRELLEDFEFLNESCCRLIDGCQVQCIVRQRTERRIVRRISHQMKCLNVNDESVLNDL
jgi:hypothetical protein